MGYPEVSDHKKNVVNSMGCILDARVGLSRFLLGRVDLSVLNRLGGLDDCNQYY